jgi:hypothetical protein
VQLRPDEFWALTGMSFEVRRSERVEIIGRIRSQPEECAAAALGVSEQSQLALL